MENLEINVNVDKLNSFLFELKFNINKSINHGFILNDVQCFELIENKIIESDNIFKYNSNEAMYNLRDQIFAYFFDNENLEIPLSNKIKELSLLN